MNPEDHNTTNTPGAANTAKSSSVRGFMDVRRSSSSSFQDVHKALGRCAEMGKKRSLPPHQFLGALLVVLEKLLVILALDHLRLQAERFGLLLMLLGIEGFFQRGDQGGFHVLRQSGGRRDAAGDRPDLVVAL